MHQAISVGPVECAVSAFTQFHHGVEAHHGTIVFWLSQTSQMRPWMAWRLHEYACYPPSNTAMARPMNVPTSIGTVAYRNMMLTTACGWSNLTYLPMGSPFTAVIHVDTILCCAHLIPVYDSSRPVPHAMKYSNSLDSFDMYYINRYANHHMYEVVI